MAVAVARMRSGLEVEAARARRDPLTGLLNRRGFLEIAGQEVERSRRFRHSMTVAYLDCDDFKIVNDTRGHDVGDRLLCIIAGVMQSSLRALDVPARVGGDEFVVLLPETEADEARDTLERLRAAVRAALTPAGYAVTLSIGAVTLARPPDSVEAVLEHADRVMYRAKHRGKARLEQDVVAGDDDQGDASPGSRLE
jgi:diguanylate cyclase (GGDEF)-like protein